MCCFFVCLFFVWLLRCFKGLGQETLSICEVRPWCCSLESLLVEQVIGQDILASWLGLVFKEEAFFSKFIGPEKLRVLCFCVHHLKKKKKKSCKFQAFRKARNSQTKWANPSNYSCFFVSIVTRIHGHTNGDSVWSLLLPVP